MDLIDKLIQATISDHIQWERTGYKSLFYTIIGDPSVVISCYLPNCYIEWNNKRYKFPCDDLQRLCQVIHDKITEKDNFETYINNLCK